MPSALVPQLICPPDTHLLTEFGLNQLTPVVVVPLGSNLSRDVPSMWRTCTCSALSTPGWSSTLLISKAVSSREWIGRDNALASLH